MATEKYISIPIAIGVATAVLSVGINWGIARGDVENLQKVTSENKTDIRTNTTDLRDARDILIRVEATQQALLQQQQAMAAAQTQAVEDLKQLLRNAQ